ncbi:hypothetical protein TNCV_1976551 [Trichonephila clavipes]|nr:hypothetical protein TNCV_1976551 [Trichonephila clavipes]
MTAITLRTGMSARMRLQIVWPVRAAIKILHMVAALLCQKLLRRSHKISIPLGGRTQYRSGIKETVLVLLCLGGAVGEAHVPEPSIGIAPDSTFRATLIACRSMWLDCREEFQKFKNVEFDVEGKQQCGKTKAYKNAGLEVLLVEDSCQTQE